MRANLPLGRLKETCAMAATIMWCGGRGEVGNGGGFKYHINSSQSLVGIFDDGAESRTHELGLET